MIWFAWRRQRTQVLVSLGVIALAALLMVLALGGDDPLFLAGVTRHLVTAGGLVWLPMILGIFAGAPLFAREASRGTHTFVFTQSVSRWRWFASRALMATVPITVALLGLGLLYSKLGAAYAWSQLPMMLWPAYESSGTVLAAYFLIATAIGAVAGLFVKNTVAAMAITLAAYLLLVFSISGIGSQVIPMEQQKYTLEQSDDAHTYSASMTIEYYVDSGGKPIEDLRKKCPGMGTAECAKDHGAEAYLVEYHPKDHYWPMQLVDTAVVLAITGALAGIGAWRLRTWYP